MSTSKPQAELLGRLSGIVVFVAGIALLVFVFAEARALFERPVDLPSNAAGIGAALATLLKQVLFLIVMTVVASVITSRGLAMYYAANPWTDSRTASPQPSRNGKTDAADSRPAPAPANGSLRKSEASEA